MATVSSIFQNQGLVEWWTHVTNPFNGKTEFGTDFGMGGFGKPVGSITAGQVVYVGDGGYPGSSIGQIVQVRTPDGKLLHYQHLMSSNVVVGQTVSPGNKIGLGGGCPTGGYPSPLVGNACAHKDPDCYTNGKNCFSTGQHIEVRESDTYNPGKGVWNQAWNPNNLAVYQALAGSTGTYVPLTDITGTNNGISLPSLPNIDIAAIGKKIGVFVIGLVLLLIGFYVLFQGQIEKTVAA